MSGDTRVLAIGLVFRPKRRLNGARSLVLQVGQDPGPVQNASFSPRQLPLRLFELALGMAQTLALDWIELLIGCHTRVHGFPFSLLRAGCFLQAAEKPRVSYASLIISDGQAQSLLPPNHDEKLSGRVISVQIRFRPGSMKSNMANGIATAGNSGPCDLCMVIAQVTG
jgi:hypothetical protein